jgi:hypothetical protein
MMRTVCFVSALVVPSVLSFSSLGGAQHGSALQQRAFANDVSLYAGQGFGKDSDSDQRPLKTYENPPVIRDVIDTEAAMQHFFSSREEWLPLFRWITTDPACTAESFLGGSLLSELDFHEESSPWRRLLDIPEDEDDRATLASFLDVTQQSLIAIPVNDGEEDDEDDVEFIEEGRRLMALNRFHVLRSDGSTSVNKYDALFATCWNELAHLTDQDEEHSGSLILAPDSDLSDLRRFTDMNIMRPLEWLGLDSLFEVSSLERGSPAIRLIFKIKTMPAES